MSQPCPYCGNPDFEEEDGLLVCTSCGRQQEGGLQVVDDEVEFGTQGKLNRMKIEKQKIKVTKIYRGARAYKLYLQAWQHIMWRQSYTLIHGSAKAPSELWTVARDLWSLKLSTLVHRLDSQVQATSDEDGSGVAANDELSGVESIEDREQQKKYLVPKLWDTISLVYLAALMIRHPISLSRIYGLIRSEDLPFLRAIRLVPYEISCHLPSEYQLALDTITIPQRNELQQNTHQYIQFFSAKFDMEIPPLNWRIILYDWIVELGLPLEIYRIVKSLSGMLDYEFVYEFSSKVEQENGSTKRHRRTPIAMPELQLISLIVVATKLLFPFPLPTRSMPTKKVTNRDFPPVESYLNPLTDLSLDWSTWLQLHQTHAQPRPPAQTHIETTDRDVSKMSPEQLDDYMSWYQRMYATPDHILRQKKTDLEMSILDMFPVAPLPGKTYTTAPQDAASDTLDTDSDLTTRLCKQIQTSALHYKPANTSTDSTQEPIYPVFPTVEILQSTDPFFGTSNNKDVDVEVAMDLKTDTDNPIMFFHELAAKVACTDLKGLVRAVRYTESKMEAWIGEKMKSEKVREEDMVDGSEGDMEMDE